MEVLVTVWHTGTQYVMQERPNVVQIHAGHPRLYDDEQVGDMPWITTYRDPHLVAAAWANRYTLDEVWSDWYQQWGSYRDDVLPRASEVLHVADFDGPVVKPGNDITGAKKAYETGDMDTFYSVVPKFWVDYALEMSEGVRHESL